MDGPDGRKLRTVASRDGTPIAVWSGGAGPPLLLVHGTSADHRRWAPVLPALERHFTVFAMDRRGRGRSGDAETYAIEREFEDVAAVVAAAGEPVHVVGHSYGGVCALEASLLTDAVARLVLYEPPLGFVRPSPHVVEQLDALLAAGERDELVAAFLQNVAGVPDEQIQVMRSLPAWEARLATAGTIPREERTNREYLFDPERFRLLTVETLFLQGSESPEPFKAAGRAVADALPNCRVVVLQGQTHVAMDTATDLFLSEVLGFLTGEAASV